MALRFAALLLLGLSVAAVAGEPAAASNPRVIIETSAGDIEIELFESQAPETVKNFLRYVDDKFYDGTVFHRVLKDFVIQGGGFSVSEKKPGALEAKKTRKPIKNEATNRLRNEVGTIAMARTAEPHSAASEFYINIANNRELNHISTRPHQYGYCVFGRVTSGMDVVKQISLTKVENKDVEIEGQRMPMEGLPAEAVIIKSIKRKTAETAK